MVVLGGGLTIRPWSRVGLAMFGVGWGSNQFASLLGVYRDQSHMTQTTVTAIFGTYALGLIPALLVAGPLSDRRGRRSALRPVLIISIVASVLLVAGANQAWLLFAGRFLAGVASGAGFGPGSAWIKELSAAAPDGTGARRSAIWLSAGFGAGPLIAGLIAQWAPLPEVLPYLVHLALMLVITPLAWNTPETVAVRTGPSEGAGTMARAMLRSANQARFLLVVLPAAPWVFALPTITFTVVTSFVTEHTAGIPIAFTAVVTGLTLLTGVLVQPLATRVEHLRQGAGLPVGLLAATTGLGLAAVVAVTSQALLVVPVAVLMGGGYGILLVSGLREVERLAAPGELAGLVAVFYALTYLGFAGPYLLAELAPHLGYPTLMLVTAAVALGTAAWTGNQVRATSRLPEPDPTAP